MRWRVGALVGEDLRAGWAAVWAAGSGVASRDPGMVGLALLPTRLLYYYYTAIRLLLYYYYTTTILLLYYYYTTTILLLYEYSIIRLLDYY